MVSITSQKIKIPVESSSHSDEQLVGTVFDNRYEIMDFIGEGGMGKVYKARHRMEKRISAIKIMHPDLCDSLSILSRFKQEVDITGKLHHPNIVSVHDIGMQPRAFMVMDYLQGESLAYMLSQSSRIDYKRSLPIFLQICEGLTYIHKKGIVHRDLKPSNIMLLEEKGKKDFVKIVDFGIAKMMLKKSRSLSRLLPEELCGSPFYISPEQCQRKSVDARSDIYSLGCLMYRTITGHQPITGGDYLECLQNHVSQAPKCFDDFCPEISIPNNLENIILKCIAKERENRFQSTNELKEALESLDDQLALNI